MTLSPHIIVDNIPDEMLERAFQYIQRVQQIRFVNIGAGAQIDRGMNFVTRVHQARPDIRIVWRNLDPEDTGILARPDYTPEKLYAEKVTKYLKWFQDNKVIFMPDNETSGDDNRMRLYARDEAKIANMLHADGLNGAFCRFSTGTIQDGSEAGKPNQYPLLKPIFDAMNEGDIISPNEYRNRPGASSAGHLERYKQMWVAAGRKLPTFIGEAGVSVNYDPGKGYQSINMTDEAFCKLMLDDEIWYENGAIDRSVYLIGGYTHETFRWRLGVFDYLENHYAKLPPVIVQPPSPPPEPTLPTFPTDFNERAERGIVVSSGIINVRKEPKVSSLVIDTLSPDAIAQYIPVEKLKLTERVFTTLNGVVAAWIPVRLNVQTNGVGWVWSGVISWKPIPPFNEQALIVLYNHVLAVSNQTRRISLELAALSDDLVKDAELLDALIKSSKPK